ncbi:hypothetical protein L1D19_20220 [Vibrio natriegens]|uniref:hypothetical protein n=1 Tax=Vibrio natriegens TaxID=691 RepID=UPI001EFCBBDA|nr:hypothetical protein [Vibrio natriegens]MCG9702402.1 hypothetical protein [Vibrio natriegens]
MNNAIETRRITLSSINGDDKRYQIRESEGASWGEKTSQADASKNHINAIVKALTDNPKLRIPRIEVVEDPSNADQYIIVDGFHRYNAFCKIFKRSKGKRYKQLRVEVHTQGVSAERYLSINTEHHALPLTAKQRTEQQWQEFLSLQTTELTLSIEQTSERIGLATSTISNWRSEAKKYKSKGFFNTRSGIAQSPLGFPVLAACRDALKEESYAEGYEDRDTLTEKDKGLLEAILKQALKADNPDHLKAFVDQFWRENPKLVPYDMPVADRCG